MATSPQQTPHLAFHAKENRVAGFNGCNRFFASYEQNDNALKIIIMGGGRARCEETSQLEADFMNALHHTEQFQRQGDQLILTAGDKILLTFVGLSQ